MNKTVSTLLNELPENRRKDVKALRSIIKRNMPLEIKESLEGDQLVYTLPLKYYPDNYTKKPLLYATLTNRKSYISLNLICIHNDKKNRKTFSKKILNTGVCSGASGCCYKIKSVNQDLVELLEKEITDMDSKKFISVFRKYRQK